MNLDDPYSSLRTSSHAVVWDPSYWDETTIAFTIARDLTLSASLWACFRYKAHIEGLIWHSTKGVEIQGICTKMPLFQACPSCGSQVHARKLACPCGHVFRGSKPLTTKNASRKSDVSAVRALETEEQTAKRRKSDREHVVETRALETEEQTATRRKSNQRM